MPGPDDRPETIPQAGIIESEIQLRDVAHDLNNVLTTVMTYADLLTISLETGPELDDLQEIKKAVRAGAGLIGKLKMFSHASPYEPDALKTCGCGATLEGGRDVRSDVEPASTRKVDE